MKNLEQLEQEAQQAREDVALALAEVLPFGTGSVIADKLILASVAMATYQFALGMQEVSGDGSGESLPEHIEKKMKSNIAESQDYLTGVGWIEWGGGDQPVDDDCFVRVKFINGDQAFDRAGIFYWKHDLELCDIIAYKIVKGE